MEFNTKMITFTNISTVVSPHVFINQCGGDPLIPVVGRLVFYL